ncbi:MAG: radical SAM protein [Candidatus Magnetoovum sp. WYHC-5]|nr:radical SAM protein [Candidatus Magnetoovum sp. WYHC-5]
MGVVEHKPYVVSWNLTKGCNLTCPHCYMDAGTATKDDLTTAEVFSVIDSIGEVNSRAMLILTGGEPMLRKDIEQIVEYADKKGMITVMGSNGSLFNKDNLKRLKECGLKGLGISIDSVNADAHDAFRGMSGLWDKAVENLRYAKGLAFETQMDVTITDMNVDEIEEFVALGVELGVRAVNFFFLVCVGRAMKSDISVDNYDRALNKIAELYMSEDRLMVRARCAPHYYRILHEKKAHIPSGSRGCLAWRSYFRIDPKGNVTPCPYMEYSVGNVRQMSVKELWGIASDVAMLRTDSYKGRCGECEYTQICGGCRARSLVEKNDLMDEDSLCSYMPMGNARVVLDEDFERQLQWEEKAKARINRVPAFMRSIVVRAAESKAKRLGISVITESFIDEMKMNEGAPAHKR